MRPDRNRAALLRTVGLELALVLTLFLAYRYARLLVGHSSAVAFGNSADLIAWERAVRLPNELDVQQLLLASETVTRLANIYYAAVHFPLTAAFLVWLFVRSRERYREIRTSMALLTGMAMVIHAAFPLAPARMLSGLGFVDTAKLYGPTVYEAAPEADSVANQFAAMPSLHFGWAVVVAMGVIRVSPSRWRWLWIAHPTITLLVIVGTGNHYWSDALVAAGLIVLAEWIVRSWKSTGGRLLGAGGVRAVIAPAVLAPAATARAYPYAGAALAPAIVPGAGIADVPCGRDPPRTPSLAAGGGFGPESGPDPPLVVAGGPRLGE